MGIGMALSIILYISSILAATASSCGLVKFVLSGGTYGLALGLYHLPIVFIMKSSLHGASWAYEYDAVERVSKRMMICFFMIKIYLSIIACNFSIGKLSSIAFLNLKAHGPASQLHAKTKTYGTYFGRSFHIYLAFSTI